MAERILYKYLDAKGGLMMLRGSNLQFTNATRLNDPSTAILHCLTTLTPQQTSTTGLLLIS